MAEHSTVNRRVAGSSPALPVLRSPCMRGGFLRSGPELLSKPPGIPQSRLRLPGEGVAMFKNRLAIAATTGALILAGFGASPVMAAPVPAAAAGVGSDGALRSQRPHGHRPHAETTNATMAARTYDSA